jgi:NADH-quinone oxidoreductase subunit J
MVIFVFVIMLLNLGEASDVKDVRGIWGKLLGAVVGIILIAEIGVLSATGLPSGKFVVPREYLGQQMARYGAVGAVAKPLYQDYSLAFELTSVLLLVAIAGAVMLGRKESSRAR